ncbi:MAG TPA: carboxypeptidase-like regulatory domain-containing protein [Chthoniobacterales bacterium]|nr:carboxypeptidase-like regulatory domain-containing protein [Chthoniobacterales bacterium]
MKNLTRNILLALLFGTGSALSGAGLPTMDVIVSDSDGNLAYRGQTAAHGTFATGQLKPGRYVVQFNAPRAAVQGESFALVISAGKQKVSAEGVAGDKFAEGGVAMRVRVGSGLNVTGQVATEGAGGLVSLDSQKIRIMNGKRYLWVVNETGTNMGGRWVQEGSAQDRNVVRLSSAGVQDLQDRGSQGSTR